MWAVKGHVCNITERLGDSCFVFSALLLLLRLLVFWDNCWFYFLLSLSLGLRLWLQEVSRILDVTGPSLTKVRCVEQR